MNKLLILLFLLFTGVSFGQVGIGTILPQEDLHIGGTDSTIRIDGLNSINNPDNNGISTNLLIDGQGNLVLGPSTNKIRGKIAADGTVVKIDGATIIKMGIGAYRVVFNTPMPDSDYLIFLSCFNTDDKISISYSNQTIRSFDVNVKSLNVINFAIFDFIGFRTFGSSTISDVDVEFMFKVEPLN